MKEGRKRKGETEQKIRKGKIRKGRIGKRWREELEKGEGRRR